VRVPLASARGLLLSALLALSILSVGAAQPPTGRADKADKKTADDKKKPAPPALPFPPGTVVAVYDNLADALRKMPNAVLLSPEKYQELLDEIARLRKQLERPRPRTPSKCLLKGKVDAGLVVLQAQFELVTERPGEIVRLGGAPALATAVSLDGRTPRLLDAGRGRTNGTAKGRPDDEPEGFSVAVEKPGEHQLTLDLVLALSGRPAGQGFTLDLPRAAITRLELDLPGGARDVRLAGKPLGESLLAQKGNQVQGSLGAADRLDLSWKSTQPSSASAVLAAEGDVEVLLESRQVTCRAKLTLRLQGGQTAQWRLLLPRNADVKPAPGEEGRVARIDPDDPKDAKKPVAVRTIHLKESSSDPLTVLVTTSQSAPKPGSGKAVAVGPFTVLGAVRQAGSVLVSNAVADWHLELTPHGDLTRRAATDDEQRRLPNLAAAFRYGPGGGEPRGAPAWLDLEAEAVRGQIKTRSAHMLRLAGDGNGHSWQVQTIITVTPRWADVDRFAVQMPAGCELNDEGSFPLPDRVRNFSYDKTSRLVEFKLARAGAEPSLQPFTVKVEGTYGVEVDAAIAGRASLPLPRPLSTIEQDGALTVQVPAALELLGEAQPGDRLELLRQSTHELTWRCPRRAPDRIEVAWRPYHPPLRVSSLIDVTLAGKEGRVRHELRYQLPEPALAAGQLVLRVPAAVAPELHLVSGGRLTSDAFAVGAAYHTFRLAPAAPREPVVVLEYPFRVPERGKERFSVPLVLPDPNLQGEARVRLWAESGVQPSSPSDGWAEQNIEEVPRHDRLPVLVLRSERPDRPLTLRLGEGTLPFTVLFERALVRVDINDSHEQTYRVSYRLSRLAGRHVDFELPAPEATINFQATLHGKRIDPEVLASDRPELNRRLVRLHLSPELVRKPAVLELSYQLAPDRTASTPVTMTLQAPTPLGDPGSVPTRWQITAPPSWVVIAPEAGPAAPRTWARRGWLLAPQATLTGADLERWLAGTEPPAAVIEEAAVTPSLVLWRDGTPTVRLTHASQQAWLLACSLALVLLGLVLSRLPFGGRAGAWAWLVLALLLAALLLGALLWPTLAGQLAYGCQPGAVVLLLLALAQWLLHERYRRQIVFLPSFSRSAAGSSLTRKEMTPRVAHGEPSTVDAPPRAVGSSVERR
jgi:hypothetical protein